MSAPMARELKIAVDATTQVSGLLVMPDDARALLVLAHGAGAGMRHAFLEAVAADLDALGIGTLRYQFPYMERGSKRTDPPPLCHSTVRAAVDAAARSAPGLPLFAGGKSFGGRMTSQAQALAPLSNVLGLVFAGFPLHPPQKPSLDRADHLFDVRVPMLFLQGTRDDFAQPELLHPLIAELGARATLEAIPEADHSFHVPARTGRKDADVRRAVLTTASRWMLEIASAA
jgi:predicted alpha/beta-hydrolase family hydrolase